MVLKYEIGLIKRKIFEENERFYYRFAKGALLLSDRPWVPASLRSARYFGKKFNVKRGILTYFTYKIKSRGSIGAPVFVLHK